MSKRVLSVGLVVVAVLVALVVVWRRGGDGNETARKATGSATGLSAKARGGKHGLTGGARWLGQPNVKGRRVAGIVVGENGAPVRGATVRLGNSYTVAGLAPAGSRVTDDTGRFDFGVQAATLYVVTADVPKLTGALQTVDLRDPLVNAEQLTLMLHACTASIHGTIYDTAGGAIGGAFVARIAPPSLYSSQSGTQADDSGTYELCIPAGGAAIAVTADGYAATVDRADVYGRTRRDYRLVPGTSLNGRVVRAGDHAPVEGAQVELRPEQGPMFMSAASDANGKFHFDGVAPGRHQISARGERLMTAQEVDAIAEIGSPSAEIVVEVVPSVSVSGKVVEKGGGKGIAGVRVALMPTPRARVESWRFEDATTQDDGTFVIDHVLPATYRVQIGRGDESPTRDIEVRESDVSGIVLELGPRASIAGRVLYDNKPVDGALVRGGRVSTSSNADGSFTLRGLDDGTVELYAESHLVGAFTRAQKVTLAAGEAKTGVDLVLDLSASIAGVVVDQNDAPVEGAFLRFSLLHGQDFGAATTAADGSFTARSMSGGGDYVYEVRQRDGSAIVYPPVSGKRHPPITLKDGASHVTGVRVKVRVEKLVIAGTLTDMVGKPVPDATVQAIPRDGRWFRVPTATTDQNGVFRLEDLPDGTFQVRAQTGRGEASMDNVAAGRTDVALRLLDPGGIDVTLKGFTGKPEIAAFRRDDQYTRYGATLVGSTYQLRNLPVGRYQVAATDGVDRRSTTVDVRAGGIATATLELGGAGIVEGTVVDAAGSPVAGMTCLARDQAGDGVEAQTKTDAAGAFRIERTPAGDDMVGCYDKDRSAWRPVQVTAGQVTKVQLTAAKRRGPRDGKEGRSGMKLEDQLDDVLVASIVPNSPAARAGMQVGDVIHSVDGVVVTRGQSWLALSRIEEEGDTVKIVIERNDNQQTLQITYPTAPSPGSASPP